MRLAHCARQPFGRGWRENEMHVVRHQAICPARDGVGATTLRKEVAIQFVIAAFEKQPLPTIAALSDMVRRVGENDARQAGHERKPWL